MRPYARTLRDLWRHAISRLQAAEVSFGHGTSSASDEAAWLLLWGLHLPLDRLEDFLDARLSDREISNLLDLIARRCDQRLPAAYLTGEAWLRGLRFACDSRALVPRSPIAELLDTDALSPWLAADEVSRVLDLCTGGGSLAIFAALAYPEAQVVGADLSAQALGLAKQNVSLHGLDDRITLAQGDLFDAVGAQRFDLVICNPPYVNQQSMDALPAEYLHEPQSALAGGADGMDLVRRILEAAPSHLNPQGALLLEIGHEVAHFEAAFARLECTWLSTEAAERQIALITADALRSL
ncbi:MAG: 50S ribosomal protein L3 N(5)-glutamine methyltransferase [Burkholderiaceae bacterium]